MLYISMFLASKSLNVGDLDYPCLLAPSQLLPTNILYAVQIGENIGTPPSPFFLTVSYEQLLRCQFFARKWVRPPPPFSRLSPID